MAQREKLPLARDAAHAPCDLRASEHIPRQAPRGNVLDVWGAGNIISMDRKKSAPADGPEDAALDLSRADKKRMTDQIGRQLRGMYDGLLNQPVPDRFMELVSRLEHDGTEPDRDS